MFSYFESDAKKHGVHFCNASRGQAKAKEKIHLLSSVGHQGATLPLHLLHSGSVHGMLIVPGHAFRNAERKEEPDLLITWIGTSTTTTMLTPAETEKALRDLFKKLRTPARAICHFPKPPQRKEVCGFSIYYKGALVREYYGKDLLKEFEKTCREKDLWAET